MKLPLITLTVLAILISYYLFHTYTRFFDRIGEFNLPDQYLQFPNGEVVEGQKNSAINYLVLGDSLSRGVGADSYESTFPYLIGLKQSGSLHIYNEAQPGARIEHLASQLNNAKDLNPQIVTILIGINDIFERTPIDKFAQDYEALLTELDKKNSKVYVFTIPYLGSPDSVSFPYNYLLDSKIKQFNARINLIVKNHKNVLVFDLYAESNQAFKHDRSLYSKDLFHPNNKGYILFSDLFISHANLSP